MSVIDSIIIPDGVIGAFIVAVFMTTVAIMGIIGALLRHKWVTSLSEVTLFGVQPTQRLRWGYLVISVLSPALWLSVALSRFGLSMLCRIAPDASWQVSVTLSVCIFALAWLMVVLPCLSVVAVLYIVKRPTAILRRKVVRCGGLHFAVYYQLAVDGHYYSKRALRRR